MKKRTGQQRGTRRRPNVEEGFFDHNGQFHPIRRSKDYNEFVGGDLEPRSRKLTYETMTLSQFVRSQGGIKPDRDGDNAGEWRRLTAKESGVRGLAFEGAKKSADRMAENAREAGFKVPRDPAAFLDVLEADALGRKVVRHPEYHAEEGWRRRNGMFTEADAKGAKKVSAEEFMRGAEVRVKGSRKTARIVQPIRDKHKGVVAYKLSTGRFVGAEDVQLVNSASRARRAEPGPLFSAFAVDAARSGAQVESVHSDRRRGKVVGETRGWLKVKWEGNGKAALVQPDEVRFLNPAGEGERLFWVDAYVGRQLIHQGATTAKDKHEAIRKAKRAYKEAGDNPRKYRFVARPARVSNPLVEDDIAYIDREGHRYVAYTYAEGRRHQIGSDPDSAALARRLRAKHYRVVFLNPLLETAGHVASIVGNFPAAEELFRVLKKKFGGKGRKNNPDYYAPEGKAKWRARINVSGVGLLTVATGETKKEARERGERAVAPEARRGLKVTPVARSARAEKNPAPAPAPSNVKKLFSTFQGRENSGEVKEMWTPASAPDDLAQLGELVELKLKGIRRRWTFEDNPAVLCGSGGEKRQRLYIALTRPYATPAGYKPVDAIIYGEVEHVVYKTSKPHLYLSHSNGREDEFIHELGEEGGRRPVLVMRYGVLELRGGDYTIRAEGIRD